MKHYEFCAGSTLANPSSRSKAGCKSSRTPFAAQAMLVILPGQIAYARSFNVVETVEH